MKKTKKSIFRHKWQLFCLTIVTCTLIVWVSPIISQKSQAETSATIAAITTQEPEIPVDELKLLLKPLTQEELEVEAKAWQGLLKAKVQEISNAEIAIKRKNRETRKSQEAVDAVEKAKKLIEEAEEAKNTASPGSPELQEAEKNLEAARKELAKAQETVEEAIETKKESIEATKEATEATKEAIEAKKEDIEANNQSEEAQEDTQNLEEVTEAIENEDTQNLEEVTEAIENEANDTDETDTQQELAEKGKQLEAVSEQLEDASEDASEVKNLLVVGVTELLQQQTAIADRFDTVLDEFESKGGKPESFRQYLESVSGVEIDVSDTEGLWLRIASWLKSEEGGLRWAINLGIFSAIVATSVIVAAILSFVTNRSLLVIGGVSDSLRQFLVKFVQQATFVVGVLLALTA